MASAGQIVFTKAGGLWSINDDGSGAHLLNDVSGAKYPSVLPGGGTTIAFQTADSGVAIMSNGVMHQLDTEGSNPSAAADNSDLIYKDPHGGITSLAFSGGVAAPWTVPNNTSSEPYVYNDNSPLTDDVAADPVLSGGKQLGVYPVSFNIGGTTTYCAGGSCDGLAVADQSDSSPQSYVVETDDSPQVAAAWSTDGSHIAVIEGGAQCGVWVYAAVPMFSPANPASGTTGTANPSWHAYYAFADPAHTNCSGTSVPYTALTWAGSSLVVAYGGDLYKVAASCTTANPDPSASASPNCATTSTSIARLTTDGQNDAPTWTSSSTWPGGIPAPEPTNQSRPTVAGSAVQGQTLTASPAAWNWNPTSYSYTWDDCPSSTTSSDVSACTPIQGATSQTYTLTTSDVGHKVVVFHNACNVDGCTADPSLPSAVVTATSTAQTPTATQTATPTATATPTPNPNPNPSPSPLSHCTVPKLAGLTAGQARSALIRADCVLGSARKRFAAHVKRGHVISQSARAGAVLTAGATVNIVVSKGKKHSAR